MAKKAFSDESKMEKMLAASWKKHQKATATKKTVKKPKKK